MALLEIQKLKITDDRIIVRLDCWHLIQMPASRLQMLSTEHVNNRINFTLNFCLSRQVADAAVGSSKLKFT